MAGSSTSLEADQFINSKFQIGSLSSIQPCDELSSLVLVEAWVGFYQLPQKTWAGDKLGPQWGRCNCVIFAVAGWGDDQAVFWMSCCSLLGSMDDLTYL